MSSFLRGGLWLASSSAFVMIACTEPSQAEAPGTVDAPAEPSETSEDIDGGAARPAKPSDAGSGKDAGKDAKATSPDGSPAACNDLAQLGPAIIFEQRAESPPTLGGGTIPDGTYVAVEGIVYTGPGGPTGPIPIAVKDTTRVTGNIIDVRTGSGILEAIQRYTVVFSGNQMTWTKTCPSSGGTKQWEYGVSDEGGKISLLLKTLDGQNGIWRLEKQ